MASANGFWWVESRASQPNFCGKCTSDTQCTGGQICNIASGQCVANSCSASGSACTQNASDFCCTTTCYPGACCADATCKATLGSSAVCSNHTCTTCDPVVGANPVYLVDPVNGDDGSATGSGTSSGGSATVSCSFATITRALQAIGPNPAAGTVLKVIGASTVPFQADLGSNANQGAGICVQLDANSGTLMARGNQFSGGAKCATTASVLELMPALFSNLLDEPLNGIVVVAQEDSARFWRFFVTY
jgi:hypothetical protein